MTCPSSSSLGLLLLLIAGAAAGKTRSWERQDTGTPVHAWTLKNMHFLSSLVFVVLTHIRVGVFFTGSRIIRKYEEAEFSDSVGILTRGQRRCCCPQDAHEFKNETMKTKVREDDRKSGIERLTFAEGSADLRFRGPGSPRFDGCRHKSLVPPFSEKQVENTFLIMIWPVAHLV